MARIIYSGLVTKIAGSIGGTTFQSNKHGFTVKNKANMVSPQSIDQNSAKARFALAVSSWSSAAQFVRDNWNAWANANPQYTFNNPSSMLSGFEVFVRWHILHFRFSLTVITNPAGSLQAIPVFAPTVDWSTYEMVVHPNASFGSEPLLWNLSAAVMIKPSQTFNGSRPRYVGYSGPAENSINIPYSWTSKYGYVKTPGNILLLRFQVWNGENGQVAAPQDYRIVTPA